jgi:hypothetical protein
MAQANEIIQKIQTLKGVHKLSDAQTISSLRELYGISHKEAAEMLMLVLRGRVGIWSWTLREWWPFPASGA